MKFVLNSIKFYQKAFSPLFNFGRQNCRFYPSCSEYALKAVEKEGILKGGLKSFSRILRCGPWSKGGVDFP